MPLDARTIKSQLNATSWKTRDNVAQAIVNGASRADLASLDDEGVLLLHEAMAGGWKSKRDAAAIKILISATQYQPISNTPDFGVALIKNASVGVAAITTELSSDLVKRLYAAENKRLSTLERIGIDGSTIGRGQLGQSAFDDVTNARHYQKPWQHCVRHYVISTYFSGRLRVPYTSYFDMTNRKVRFPTVYGFVHPYDVLEDFVVAAYLAIRLKAATKTGRSSKDAARFAVAVYHGMFSMVAAAQKAASDTINWAPVEAELLRGGHTDEVAYVHEVVI